MCPVRTQQFCRVCMESAGGRLRARNPCYGLDEYPRFGWLDGHGEAARYFEYTMHT